MLLLLLFRSTLAEKQHTSISSDNLIAKKKDAQERLVVSASISFLLSSVSSACLSIAPASASHKCLPVALRFSGVTCLRSARSIARWFLTSRNCFCCRRLERECVCSGRSVHCNAKRRRCDEDRRGKMRACDLGKYPEKNDTNSMCRESHGAASHRSNLRLEEEE